jgi:hypothetical protein
MARRWVVLIVVVAALVGGGFGVYSWCNSEPDMGHVDPPTYSDNPAKELPRDPAFNDLAEKDPIRMLEACLSRYSREVKGFRAMLEKEETNAGHPYPRERIRLAVKGELPNPADPAVGEKPKAHVRMVWDQGARTVIGFPVKGALYIQGEHQDEMMTWRPTALLKKENWLSPKSTPARGASRYCIRDTGLRTVMLRTLTAFERHQKAGTLKYVYLGRRKVAELGDRDCHVIKRINPTPELDAFALDEPPPADPKQIEQDGFTSVTIYIDAERWLQVGTELRRGETLVGAFYYKDVELNPTFPPDTFTPEGLKAAAK